MVGGNDIMNELIAVVNIFFVPAISVLICERRNTIKIRAGFEVAMYWAVFIVSNVLVYYVANKCVNIILSKTIGIDQLKCTVMMTVFALIIPYVLDILQKAFPKVQFRAEKRENQ